MQSTNHTLQRLSDLAQCAVASQEPTDMMALSSAITDQLFDAKSLASDQHEHTVLAHVVTLCDTHQVRLIASTHTRSLSLSKVHRCIAANQIDSHILWSRSCSRACSGRLVDRCCSFACHCRIEALGRTTIWLSRCCVRQPYHVIEANGVLMTSDERCGSGWR
jgi:hypothetical protein